MDWNTLEIHPWVWLVILVLVVMRVVYRRIILNKIKNHRLNRPSKNAII